MLYLGIKLVYGFGLFYQKLYSMFFNSTLCNKRRKQQIFPADKFSARGTRLFTRVRLLSQRSEGSNHPREKSFREGSNRPREISTFVPCYIQYFAHTGPKVPHSRPAQTRKSVIFGLGVRKNSIRSTGVKLVSPHIVFATLAFGSGGNLHEI